MCKPLVVIVTGAPCTGKTTLARRLAHELRLPLVTKDDIKESLFDTLGWRDRPWSQRLGGASFELLFYFCATQLEAGRSHILEGNFFAGHTEQFVALQRQYAFLPVQIHCHTSAEVIQARFVERAESGRRHPGHGDQSLYAELAAMNWETRHPVLAIGGRVFELDTTDLTTIDYRGLLDALESALWSTDE